MSHSGDPGATQADSLGTLWASSRRDFDVFLGLLQASAAEPTWFAVPVEAREDGESYEVVFDVATHRQSDLRVYADDRCVSVLGLTRTGRRQERRICRFSECVDPDSIEVSRAGQLLLVQVRKKRLTT
jgi:HSP20 family molecular chaperone IbpA